MISHFHPNDSSLSQGYYDLALAYWDMGSRAEAVRALEMALNFDPNHLQANELLKTILPNHGRFIKAA
jgi:Tfp pilus assembly protein PilF